MTEQSENSRVFQQRAGSGRLRAQLVWHLLTAETRKEDRRLTPLLFTVAEQ